MARPRQFDEAEVLDKALQVFWRQGYEGTSLSDLLDATGLTKSSLYAAFGGKADLFRQVVKYYDAEHLGFRQRALDETTPRQIVERLLHGTVDLHTGPNTPPGCLETGAALACSPECEPIRRELAQKRARFGRRLRQRFEAVKEAGPFPPGMSADDAALLVDLTVQGMAVEAMGGATKGALRRIVRAFLLSWPETSPRAAD
jgi:AcrR family transcriptional regulator